MRAAVLRAPALIAVESGRASARSLVPASAAGLRLFVQAYEPRTCASTPLLIALY